MRTRVRLVFNRTKTLKGEMRENAERIVRKTALDVLDRASHIVPVDTGNLKGSLSPGADDNVLDMSTGSRGGRNIVAIIGTNVLYSAFVEYGTVHAPAQPYLTPAVEAMRPVFIAAMQHLLKDGR